MTIIITIDFILAIKNYQILSDPKQNLLNSEGLKMKSNFFFSSIIIKDLF